MKHSRETIFSINDRIIGYTDKTQGKYVMRFLDPTPELHALAKLAKYVLTWHGRVVYLGYKNLLQITKYILGMEEISGPAPNKICR